VTAQSVHIQAPDELAEEVLTPWQRVGRNLGANRLAMVGGGVLALFFALAIVGWWTTSNHEFFKENRYFRVLFKVGILLEEPFFNPSVVRLPDRLRPPFARPKVKDIPATAVPPLGIYLLGTDDLGRDVFARMLEGSKIAMAVGFVAVGISIILGVILGGIAGFYRDHRPGLAPALGAAATLGAGALLFQEFGAFPVAGIGAGGLFCWYGGAKSARGIIGAAAFGGLAGYVLSPLGPAIGGNLEWWLRFPAAALAAVPGVFLGIRSEEEEFGAVFLGAFTAGVIVLLAAYFFIPSGGAAWTLALAAAALAGGIAHRLDAPQLFRKMRLFSVDVIFVTLVDVQLSFPTFFLLLTVIALLSPSIWNIMIVIGITGWVGPARFVRAEILSLKERPFVEAGRAIGVKDGRLIFTYLVPNALAPVLVSATIGIAGAIMTEAALSFLGFGVPPPDATWGNIISDGKKYLFDAPWLIFIPGFTILIVVLAFNLFGEGLRDAMDPRAKPQ
jgi:ABC-type dipeptide/oligopeptide/nickel transport system permease subunit